MYWLFLVVSFVFVSKQAFGQSPHDPFATYQASLDHQLLAILQDLHVNAAGSQTLATETQPQIVAAAVTDDAHGEFALFAKQFWGDRGADLAVALKRLSAIRPTLENILQREGIPRDLIGIVLIESAAQPFAQSPRRARGLWQLIPETARQYGLDVSQFRDQRIDTEDATRAAARYLRDLYAKFENWPLALAAYNAGPEAVQKALRGSTAATFEKLSSARLLPAETLTYVPAVLAAMKLFSRRELPNPATPEPLPIFAPIGLSLIPDGRGGSAW